MEPQVPGPGLPKPAPKSVAIAHHGMERPFLTGGAAGSLIVMGVAAAVRAQAAEVFQHFRIEDGRAYLVDA